MSSPGASTQSHVQLQSGACKSWSGAWTAQGLPTAVKPVCQQQAVAKEGQPSLSRRQARRGGGSRCKTLTPQEGLSRAFLKAT